MLALPDDGDSGAAEPADQRRYLEEKQRGIEAKRAARGIARQPQRIGEALDVPILGPERSEESQKPTSEKDPWSDVEQLIEASEADAKRLRPHYSHVLLPAGALIHAQLIDVEVGVVAGARKWFALFEIHEFNGVSFANRPTILRSYNAPRKGWLSRSHELARDFCAVTGLVKPPPVPRDCSARAFINAFLKETIVEATTRVVKQRMDRRLHKWRETPEGEWYSVIDSITRLADGVPRVLQRRQTSDQRKKK